MIFYDRIQDSLRYIDNNLDEELTLEAVAGASGFSVSHFYKIFYSVTGFTVKEYIRNKRLVRAARDLLNTDKRVIDIAEDAGFHSHEVFTRAFIQQYGMSPKNYKKSGMGFKNFDKLSEFGKEIAQKYQMIRDDIRIDVRVQDRDEMILIGMELRTSVKSAIEKNEIEKFWKHQFNPRIPEINDKKSSHVSCAYEILNPLTDELYHMACIEVTQEKVPENLISKRVPPMKYAIFTVHRALNPIEYSILIQYIYGEWLPLSGFEEASEFTMDMNYSDIYYTVNYHNLVKESASILEIYIPVR